MDELVKRLRSLKVLLGTDSPEVRGWSSAVQQAAQKTVNDAIAALSAQQEPVAWEYEDLTGKKTITDQPPDRLLNAERYKHRPLVYGDTAPPSGVREGMLRTNAEEIQWRNIRGVVKALADWAFESKDHPQYGSAWIAMVTGLTCNDGPKFELEPLTRAAEQVNAEGRAGLPERGHGKADVAMPAPSAPQSEQTHVRVPVDKLTISDCYRFGIDISSIRSTATGKESEHGK